MKNASCINSIHCFTGLTMKFSIILKNIMFLTTSYMTKALSALAVRPAPVLLSQVKTRVPADGGGKLPRKSAACTFLLLVNNCYKFCFNKKVTGFKPVTFLL